MPLKFTKNQTLILEIFFNNPEKSYYLSELARRIKKQPGVFQKDINTLVEKGILKSEKVANSRFFKLNENHPLYGEFKSIFLKTIGVQDQLENLIQSVLPSLVPPIVLDAKIAEIAEDSVTITWQTNVPAYEGIDYATSDKYSAESGNPYDQHTAQTNVKSTDHTLTLTGLTPSTPYHFRVSAYVLPGVLGYSEDITFATKASATNTEIGKIGNTDFQVQWQTGEKTSSIVDYTDTATGKKQRVEDNGLVLNHVVHVENLTPNTSYAVRVYGYDADRNLVEGGELSVRTTRDIVAPVISNIRINSALLPGQSNLLQTVISWTTDEPTTSQVFYDEGVSKSENLARSAKQEGYATEHILIVPSLKSSTVYRFRVQSEDQAGNLARSPIKTVLTPERAENVIDVIIKNIQESFGFLQKLK